MMLECEWLVKGTISVQSWARMSTDDPSYQCVYLSHSLRAMERKTGDQAKAPSLSASPANKEN